MATDSVTTNVQVFVPRTLAQRTRSHENSLLLVGWRSISTDTQSASTCIFVVVAGTATEAEAKQAGLRAFGGHDEGDDDDALHVLGVVDFEDDNVVGSRDLGADHAINGHPSTSAKTLDDERHYATTWIHLRSRRARRKQRRTLDMMRLRVLMNGGSTRCATTLITYDVPRPDQMRYLSLEPMVLPLASTAEELAERIGRGSGSSSVAEDTSVVYVQQQRRLERLVRLDPVRFADLNHAYVKGQAPGESFRTAIEQINRVSYEMDRIRQQRGSSRPTGNDGRVGFVWQALYSSCSAMRAIINAQFFGACSPVTCSASARQLSLRLGQVMVWPALGRRLRALRVHDHDPVSRLAPRYTALYNGVWLVANDVIVGQTVGSLLCENRVVVANMLHRHVRPILVAQVIDLLRWLDSWPLGVKLNTPLSRFFCDMFSGMTEVWSELLRVPHENGNDVVLPTLVYAVGIATRLLGVSMLLCILIDVVRLATLHLTVFYYIQQTVYAFFCRSITSLSHLFRGKKRNPLRGMRVDHATYDLDQLLLGTLFFTLLVFLWLTVATYYLHFAGIRLAVVVVVTVLQTALATINHLPLFALMLKLKDPARLPGGLALHYVVEHHKGHDDDDDGDVKQQRPLPVTHAELVTTSLGLADIFRGHLRHIQSLQRLPHRIVDIVAGRRI